MNIRDYWISKLPEVRKQSSATGKLIESLLVNDSKVSRTALTEIAKLNKSITLKEDMSKDERDTFIKNNFGSNDRLNKIVKNVYGNENKDIKTISKEELKTLKQNYLNKKNNEINKLQTVINHQKTRIKQMMENKEDPAQISALENELQAQITQRSEKVNAIPLTTYEPRYVLYFKKIMKAFGELFEIAGVKLKNFRNYWKSVYKLGRPMLVEMIAISLFFSIVFGVSVYIENKSIGNAIFNFINRFLISALYDIVFLAVYYEFFVVIHKLIYFLRGKYYAYKNSKTVTV